MEKNNNTVVKLSNDQSVTKDSYEKLASRFKETLSYAKGMMHEIRHRFDEAFTKHENSNPHIGRKLKDFEVHEKRAKANSDYYKISRELEKEIKALEEGVQKYGIDIRDQEDNSNDWYN